MHMSCTSNSVLLCFSIHTVGVINGAGYANRSRVPLFALTFVELLFILYFVYCFYMYTVTFALP
jgi:hypothetical protein